MRKLSNAITIVAVLGLFAGPEARAATTWTVDGGGGGDFLTISAAIAAASDNDTINVNAGTYDEVFTINKPLSLYGAGAGSTILTYTNTAAKSEQLIMLGANSGTTIGGSVTIDGFTFRHDAGLYGDNNLIKFRAESSGQIAIQNNVFDQNGTDITAIEESQNGGNFLIQNNDFNSRYAIWLNSAHDGQITGNTLTASRIGMGGNGAPGGGPRDLLVSGNSIDAAAYGLVLANNIERINFQGNTISNSTAAAVLYWEYGANLEWDDVTFICNQFLNNAEGIRGFYNPSATLPALVNGENNWWGDASGPSGIGFGTGDSVLVGNFDYDPWLTTPSCAVIPTPAALPLGLMLIGGLGGVRTLGRKRRRA